MKNLYKALFDFQNDCPPIFKSSNNAFGKYKFADLNAYIEGTKPYLKKYGLGITQLLMETTIETILFHVESGEYLISKFGLGGEVILKGMNAFQVEGAAISYKRKYALAAILGLATSDNDMAPKQKETRAFDSVRFDGMKQGIYSAHQEGQPIAMIEKRIQKTFSTDTPEIVQFLKELEAIPNPPPPLPTPKAKAKKV